MEECNYCRTKLNDAGNIEYEGELGTYTLTQYCPNYDCYVGYFDENSVAWFCHDNDNCSGAGSTKKSKCTCSGIKLCNP